MTLENQALRLENERLSSEVAGLRAEVERLTGERDAEIRTGQKYRELGSGIFAEINALAEQALGHPIEPGHTAVYAVELLIAENAKHRQALEVIQYTLKQGFGDQVMLNRIADVAVEALATPGEGGGAR